MSNLHSKVNIHSGLTAAGPSSDGSAGVGLAINGYNKVMAIANVGAGFATSDATVIVKFQKDIVTTVDSDAASTDWVDITASSVTFTPDTLDSTGKGGIKVWDFDLVGLGLTTGLLRPHATVSAAGGTVPTSVEMIAYQGTRLFPAYATSDVAVINTST